MGPRVTTGKFCWSLTVDSGYKPFCGRTWRKAESVVGCNKAMADE